MRIRAVLSATALAAAIVLGGAGSAMAGGDHHESHSSHSSHSNGDVKFGSCGLGAAIIAGNPIFGEGCRAGSFNWMDEMDEMNEGK
ncbi:hypothetical protein [Streptomyces sp. NPDC014733]|uniref:hypothetical protein n=1 Tax=Streptomyces sp. NPDC014733 TaxID=3364885 RepID=UPI0036F9729D